VKTGRIGESSARPFGDERFAEALHGLSQPLTTLECGLELAIRHDTTLAKVRHRLQTLLEAAQVLHQRFLELRTLAGSTTVDRAIIAGVNKS